MQTAEAVTIMTFLGVVIAVWRIADCLAQPQSGDGQAPALPAPPLNVPNLPGRGCDAQRCNTRGKDGESENLSVQDEMLRLLTLVRAVNPGIGEESLVSIVYKMMSKRFVLQALDEIGESSQDCEKIIV